MRTKKQVVALSSIDLQDETYRITTEIRIDDLDASIKAIGLINSPFLKKKNSTFIIVSGFRRISALKRLGTARIKARIVEEIPHCILIAIADNSLQRPLNLIEQSRALSLLSSVFQDMNCFFKLASALGLPYNPKLVNKIKNVSLLPKFIQDSIISDTVSLSVALELGTFFLDDSQALVKLFSILGLGLNKQKELMILLKEISLREEISIHALLGEDPVKEILDSAELNRVQKDHKIRTYLRQRRYPSIAKTDQEFEILKTSLKLGKGIKIIPPKNFEGTEYTLSINFNTLTELNDCQRVFNQLLKNTSLKKFIA